jgi:hypothetical protein
MVLSIVKGKNIDYKTLIDAIPSVKISSYAFQNEGNYRFENKARAWGLDTPSHSNGSAYGDLDNDGDLDLVVNNVNMPMFIYRNETDKQYPDHHFLKVILKGDPPNTSAIGARITAIHQGKFVYLEQMPMRGFKSTVDYRPNLGLGGWTVVDSLVVQWPDGRVTLLTDVPADQVLTLIQKDARVMSLQLVDSLHIDPNLFVDITRENRIPFTHREDDFNDFERDKLLYHMLSSEGPRMCKGDVNGDGREDIFIGGAKGQAGALLVQKSNGRFIPVCEELFARDSISEDMDCALFDADGDGDLDLYVARGGNEFPSSSSALADRLYLNDGTGRFTRTNMILPAGKYVNSACVRAMDYDGDGVTELFVGGRMKPFAYGVPVNGCLLENDGKGHFRDVTAKIAPGLRHIGMIRDMLWADVDGDHDMDMIIAGDWMPLKVFKNYNGTFREDTVAFSPAKTSGWWNCLAAGDFDGDGDIDFVAGNHGLNSRFHASPQKPVSMYVNDFDLNGSVEQIICVYEGDTSYPLALKHDLVSQLPGLGKKYDTYEKYKNQQITDIFPPALLNRALHLDVYQLETSLFFNDGKGHFIRKALPVEVQFSTVYAVSVRDVNGDGNPDILLGGNLYNVKPEVGRYDASYGNCLLGDGHGNFRNMPVRETGLLLQGEVRSILPVETKHGTLLLVARSNHPVQVFRILKGQ